MTATDDLLHNAESWAENFDRGGLAVKPKLKLTILTCMDSRLNPYAMFGLQEGEAHMLRNAGGTVTDDVIRSLALSQRFLDTEEIIIVKHTNCGLQTMDEQQFRDTIREQVGHAPTWAFGALQDLEEGVRDSIRLLRDSPFLLHKDRIRGFVYDVETGKLHEVEG